MIRKCLFFATLLLLSVTVLFAQKPTVWRGDNNGIYLETGLLKEWPINGPEILWTAEGLGEGHSSPVFANDKIYLSTMIGDEGYIFIFSQNGEVLKKISYGKEFAESYPGARSSVVVAGDLMYMYSGFGELLCIDQESEEVKWRKNAFSDFDGENIRWGVTETVVLNDNMVYFTPGGKNNNVVALNRFNGELIWTSAGKGEVSAYCTPLLIELSDRKLLVTHTASHILGLDAETGELLWDYPQANRWSVHANTPMYYAGDLFCFSGYGKGGVKLDLSDDGSSISKQWEKVELDGRMGGMVVVDGYLYGSGDKAREWRCVDWETGEEKYVAKDIAKGVVIYADGMLYCYSERGELALVEATPAAFNIISQTSVELGTAQHWAHPVINNGRLFVRHGDVLIAYKIK